MSKPFSFIALFAVAALIMLAGCESTPESSAERDALHDEVQAALTRMKQVDPTLQDRLDRAYGYAIFPSVGKGGLIVGGAYGRGEVYEQGRLIGYTDLQQGSVGLQAGGQEFSELILFESQQALDSFKGGNFTLGANASAVALKSGAAASADFKDGVLVITHPKGGLMFEASVSGQKFDYRPVSQGLAPHTQPSGV